MTTPTLTDDITDVTDYTYQLVYNNRNALQLQGVWYGDQRLIPRTPAAMVAAGTVTTREVGVPFRVERSFPIHITVVTALITGDPAQSSERQATKIAQNIKELLHKNSRMGGYVIQGYVTRMQPGYTLNNGRLMTACKLTWEGISRVCLPLQS